MKEHTYDSIERVNGCEYFGGFLASICSWCGRALNADIFEYTVTLEIPLLDWSKFEGNFVALPTLIPGKPAVPAFVPLKDSEDFADGATLVLFFCGHQCRKQFTDNFEIMTEAIRKSKCSMLNALRIKEGTA
ncbi:MAG: hypothetical protein ACFFCW_26600 [Candidatus Hodarchaeota archaeon]